MLPMIISKTRSSSARPRAGEHAHDIDIGRDARHQPPGLHLVEVGEGQRLNVAEEGVADIESQTLRHDGAAPALPEGAQCADHGGDEHQAGAKQDLVHRARQDALVDHQLQQARHAELHRHWQGGRPKAEEEIGAVGAHEAEDAQQGGHALYVSG